MGYIPLNHLRKKELIKVIENKNKEIETLNERIKYLNYLIDSYNGESPYPERFFEYLNDH